MLRTNQCWHSNISVLIFFIAMAYQEYPMVYANTTEQIIEQSTIDVSINVSGVTLDSTAVSIFVFTPLSPSPEEKGCPSLPRPVNLLFCPSRSSLAREKLLPQPRRHLQNLPGQTAKYPIKTKYCALTGSKKMLPRTFLARIYVGILLIFVNSFMNDFGKTI